MRPAGPTKGLPVRSSWSPGCSPTKTMRAVSGPSPNTVCVALRNSRQRRQSSAARRSSAIERALAPSCWSGSTGASRQCLSRTTLWCGAGLVGIRAIISSAALPAPLIISRNERGLRQVPPVFLRHLRLHRLHPEARRVEDAGESMAGQYQLREARNSGRNIDHAAVAGFAAEGEAPAGRVPGNRGDRALSGAAQEHLALVGAAGG